MDEETLKRTEEGYAECRPDGGCQIRAMVDEVRRLQRAVDYESRALHISRQCGDVLQAERDELRARVAELEAREDAVFAKGYRAGFWEGGRMTPFQDEVDSAHQVWVEGGRMTHLDGPL